MTAQRYRAEIIGGGIGGFTAAAALAQRGWRVRVHERSTELRFVGSGIYTWENGLRVLEAIGACDEAIRGAHAARFFEIRDRQNKVIEQIPINASADSRLFTPVRKQLSEAIVSAATRAGVEVVTNSEAESATPDGDLWLKNGQRLKADLIVAADGVNSRIRDGLNLLKSRTTLIDGAIRLLIPRSSGDVPVQDSEKYIEFWSGTRRILYTPCNDEQLYVALTCLNSDAQAKALPLDHDLWTTSFPHLSHLISRIGGEGRWDPFEVVTLRHWSVGRIAVLGDAAHAQAPNLGQGGGCAMMTALGLAVAVEQSREDIPAALRTWEERERPLINHTQRMSGIWGALTTWPESARSAAFRLAGKWSWLNQMRMKTAMHHPTGAAFRG